LVRDIDNGKGNGTVFSEFSDVPGQNGLILGMQRGKKERTRRP
jgi:hypothetical protein